MYKFLESILQFSWLAALLASISTQAQAAETLQEIQQQFLGDFELVSYYQFPAQGDPIDMNYIGRLSYDVFGNMAGLGMPRDLPERNRCTIRHRDIIMRQRRQQRRYRFRILA